jgi:hypothetical protein
VGPASRTSRIASSGRIHATRSLCDLLPNTELLPDTKWARFPANSRPSRRPHCSAPRRALCRRSRSRHPPMRHFGHSRARDWQMVRTDEKDDWPS